MLAASMPVGAAASGASRDRAVEDAIRAAVIARTSPAFVVRIEMRTIRTQSIDGPFVAVPEPSARSGRPAVFALAVADDASPGGQRRVGSAVATITLSGTHPRAARALPRGTVLAAVDLVDAGGVLDGLPLRTPPRTESLVGARTTRDLREGQVITSALVQAVPDVRSGDEVRVLVRIDGLEAHGRGFATQSGSAGHVIRVVNADSRRALKARVTGPGEVEVVHEH